MLRLQGGCYRYEVAQTAHEQLRECIERYKEEKTHERSYLIKTRVINGRPYLLIPDEGVEVNDLAVSAGI